jgi:hypothetical protein
MEMVKRWMCLVLLASLAFGCEAEFSDEARLESPESSQNGFYFLDAELYFPEEDSLFPLQYFVDLDAATPPGINEALIAESTAGAEIYSVFSESDTELDNSEATQDDLRVLANTFGFSYGTARYAGLGFCFFLPPLDAEFSAVSLAEMLQAGNELSFGTTSGQVEIGYFKNYSGFESDPYLGYVTTGESNEEGFFRIEEVNTALDERGEAGYQLRISFRSVLYKQYALQPTATVEGSAVIFVPERQ